MGGSSPNSGFFFLNIVFFMFFELFFFVVHVSKKMDTRVGGCRQDNPSFSLIFGFF